MNPVLEIIIGFVVVIVIIIIVAKSDGKDSHNQELLRQGDESTRFNSYWKAHSHLGKEQALRRFYRDKDNRERAERLMEVHKEREKREKEEARRKYTIYRVCGYKYENFIFSLFSPLSEHSEYPQIEQSFYRLPKDFIIYKLAENRRITIDEAQGLFKEMLNNELLKGDFVYERRYLEDKLAYKEYNIGSTLIDYANVVSEADMNLITWIREHGISKSERELKNEIAAFNERLNN